MNRAEGEEAIEKVMRAVTHTKGGRMSIQKWHVRKAANSNASRKEIGKRRADKIWGWVARKTDHGEHKLKDKTQWTQEWLGTGERLILEAREDAAWEGGERANTRVSRAEVKGAVLTWIMENEEPQKLGPWRLRPQKLRQMLAARKAMAKQRGGRQAIYAALAILTAEGTVTLTETPLMPNTKSRWETWIKDSVQWMEQEQWITGEEQAKEMMHAAEQKSQEEEPSGDCLVVDMGEGWGSIRRALQALPGVTVVGVDRRRHTNTGAKHGVITAAVHHDLTERGKQDLLSTIAKKVGRSVQSWTLLWMSLECSNMSIANAINQATGSAHGKWALTEQNREKATHERISQEEEYLREALEVISNVVEALEKHPRLKFALENPATSQTWETGAIKEAMQRNPEWKLVQVDQCAFGRLSKKPTRILTNIKEWEPAGQTGNGRCKQGRCAGTAGNEEGNRAHKEQTVPNSKEKRPSQGERNAGRWDFTKEAVVNAVAEALVTEILGAAISARDNETKTNKHRSKQRDPLVGHPAAHRREHAARRQ